MSETATLEPISKKEQKELKTQGYLFEDDILILTEEIIKLSNERKTLNEKIGKKAEELQKAMEDAGHKVGAVKLANNDVIQLARVEILRVKKTNPKKQKKAK